MPSVPKDYKKSPLKPHWGSYVLDLPSRHTHCLYTYIHTHIHLLVFWGWGGGEDYPWVYLGGRSSLFGESPGVLARGSEYIYIYLKATI